MKPGAKKSKPAIWIWSGARYVRKTATEIRSHSPSCSQLYKRARYYESATGEFISRDPLEYVDVMSIYRAYFVPGAVDPHGSSVLAPLTDIWEWIRSFWDNTPRPRPAGGGATDAVGDIVKDAADILVEARTPGSPCNKWYKKVVKAFAEANRSKKGNCKCCGEIETTMTGSHNLGPKCREKFKTIPTKRVFANKSKELAETCHRICAKGKGKGEPCPKPGLSGIANGKRK